MIKKFTLCLVATALLTGCEQINNIKETLNHKTSELTGSADETENSDNDNTKIADDNGNDMSGAVVAAQEPESDIYADQKTSQRFTLTGKVGKYPVAVDLTLENGMIEGSYRYTKSGSGASISLNGHLTDTRRMSLAETVNGETTGNWDLLYNTDNGTAEFTGTMQTPAGKEFTVSLTGTVN